MENLSERGVDVSGLRLSSKCHLIMPYHRHMDAMREERLAGTTGMIGTTKRGIGPAYADKAYRTGIRAFEMSDMASLETRFRHESSIYNQLFASFGMAPLDIDAEWEPLKNACLAIRSYLDDTVELVNAAIRAGKKVLCEGAQGAMLDIDHGTYPYVTSSNTTSGGACTGAGIAPRHIRSVVGVMKAYTTRVGEGPFPTELKDETGERLRTIGGEFGATTGRPRRCGWFDSVVARYSCMVNGVTHLAITKMDVLCTGYAVDGKTVTSIPPCPTQFEKAVPIYEEFEGWMQKTSAIRSYDDLPRRARAYLERIAALSGTDIGIVSVGPGRDQTFVLGNLSSMIG
jgi:adenylosuccinate synthase